MHVHGTLHGRSASVSFEQLLLDGNHRSPICISASVVIQSRKRSIALAFTMSETCRPRFYRIGQIVYLKKLLITIYVNPRKVDSKLFLICECARLNQNINVATT